MPPTLAKAMPPDLLPLYRHCVTQYDAAQTDERDLLPDELIAGLPAEHTRLIDYLTMLGDREIHDRTVAALAQDAQHAAQQLQQLHIARARTHLEQEMRAAEAAGDHEKIASLAAQFHELN